MAQSVVYETDVGACDQDLETDQNLNTNRISDATGDSELLV